MSSLRVKLFAGATPEELEAMINGWLAGRDIKLEGFDFVADGLELAYNCMILFSFQSPCQGGNRK